MALADNDRGVTASRAARSAPAAAAWPARLRDAWRNIAVYAWRHPWARHDRLGTLLRIVRWQIGSALDGSPRDMPWINGARLRVRRGQAGLTGNLYYGLHEFCDMAFFGHFLREGDVFADIGANAGSYTVLAAKVAGARVHAFEPAPETQEALAANIALNGIAARVELHRVALGREHGEQRFTVGRDATNQFADQSDAGAVIVPVRTADEELCDKGVLAMKVDVEGAEHLVFAGATRLLAESRLVAIVIESLMPGVREAIERAGFVERWYAPKTRVLTTAPGPDTAHNHLFVRDEGFVAERLRAGPPLRFGKLCA